METIQSNNYRKFRITWGRLLRGRDRCALSYRPCTVIRVDRWWNYCGMDPRTPDSVHSVKRIWNSQWLHLWSKLRKEKRFFQLREYYNVTLFPRLRNIMESSHNRWVQFDGNLTPKQSRNLLFSLGHEVGWEVNYEGSIKEITSSFSRRRGDNDSHSYLCQNPANERAFLFISV